MPAIVDRWLERLVAAAAALAALLTIACAAAFAYGLVVRWVTGASATWPVDMAGHTLVYIVLLGAAEAFRRNEHINVDLVIVTLPPRARLVADKWASLVVLVTAVVLLWTGVSMVVFSRSINLHTSDYVELPLYLVQAAMPIGALLLALVALRRLIGSFEHEGAGQ